MDRIPDGFSPSFQWTLISSMFVAYYVCCLLIEYVWRLFSIPRLWSSFATLRVFHVSGSCCFNITFLWIFVEYCLF